MRLAKNILLSFTVALGLAGMAGGANAALVISDAATSGVTCAAGVCTAAAANAVLNAKDLKKLLDAGDVRVASGSAAMDIVFGAKFKWTKPTRLTLDAYRSIVFTLAVVAEGTGNVTLITNDGGTGGDYSFTEKGKLTFWDTSSSLIINGTNFTLIKDIETLAADIAATPNGSFALSNYYDASGSNFAASPIKSFYGVFEGLGHVIDKLTILNQKRIKHSCFGLFDLQNGAVRDVHLNNVSINSTGSLASPTGSIAGCNSGSIVNSSAQGSLVAVSSSELGGLAGYSAGDIINSYATVNISSPQGMDSKVSVPYVGGVAGLSYGTITGSHASGTISGSSNEYVGGLAGYASLILDSYATTDVRVADSVFHCTDFEHKHRRFGPLAGGLAGLGYVIQGSFATGTVTGGQSAVLGGLAGEGDTVSDSYSTGSVQGGTNSCVGGLIGLGGNRHEDDYSVSTSYSVGNVSASDPRVAGGLVGFDPQQGVFASTCWDLDTSGISDPSQGAGNIPNDPGITGLTDAQLKSGLPSGFDPAVWGQSASINNGYPYLLANPPPPQQ